MKAIGQIFFQCLLIASLSFAVVTTSNAATCEVGDTLNGAWAWANFDPCTPPVPVYNPEMKLSDNVTTGNFHIYYAYQYTDPGGCGNYGYWNTCGRSCPTPEYFVCPLGNEIATGALDYNCTGTCSSPFGAAVMENRGGCCVSAAELRDGDSACNYTGRSQYIRNMLEWVCRPCLSAYKAKKIECGNLPVIWDNETCTGECKPNCDEKRAQLEQQCGGADKVINWVESTCTGECQDPCKQEGAATNPDCNEPQNQGPPCEDEKCCQD